MARILYFGRLSDAAGASEVTVDLPAEIADTAALRDWLGKGDPILRDRLRDPRVLVAVNRVLAHGPAGIGLDDEIAFLPPVSGG